MHKRPKSHTKIKLITPVLAKDGSAIQTFDNFKYLGEQMQSSGKGF